MNFILLMGLLESIPLWSLVYRAEKNWRLPNEVNTQRRWKLGGLLKFNHGLEKKNLDRVAVSGMSYHKMGIFGWEVNADNLRRNFILFIRILFLEIYWKKCLSRQVCRCCGQHYLLPNEWANLWALFHHRFLCF